MARSRRKGRFGMLDMLIAALAALIVGAVFAHFVVPRFAGTVQARGGAIGADRFTALLSEGFPESYPAFQRVTFERHPEYGIIPAEARLMAPASRFAAGAGVGTAETFSDLDAPFATARPLDRAAIGARVRALTDSIAPAGVPRCEDYTIGPERLVRWPDWPEQRVREVVIELNIGC